MKKFLTLVVALVMVMPMMAIGDNSGSTKANAIDFDWEAPMTHTGGTKWYRVDLAPLYEEESPALNLFLANKDAFNETHTSLRATVAGQTDEKSFTIGPKQQKVWSANATMLVRLKQMEIYLTLTSDGPVLMSARVFEAQDLDETCKDALNFSWTSGITKPAGVPVWYKVNIKDAKANTDEDVCVVIKNNGTGKLTLYAGQSLDCPSSGVTKRTIELGANQTLRDTIPNTMLNGVAFDELYVSLENDQPIQVTAEYATRPSVAVMPADVGQYDEKIVPDTSLHKSDTTLLLAGQTYYFKYDVAKLNALKKYEPEFTFLNVGTDAAEIGRKMAFVLPAYVAQGDVLELAAGEETIEVLTKNTLLGLDNAYIYVKLTPDQDILLLSRFKHLREGKACKTNIDYNWDGGNRQEAKTTQWYAVDLSEAKASVKDVIVHVQNLNDAASAHVSASLAFSCPYIDLQEISRTVPAGETSQRRIQYSTYAMMTDTVWIGIETDQDIKFWATQEDAVKKAEPDTICLVSRDFNWASGDTLSANDTVWYKIDMREVRDKSALFPTVFVQNLSSTEAVTIHAELSLECPDSIENEKRSLTIAANESYSKQVSRNMFENIKADSVYLRVVATQKISLQIRLTEEAEGASCASAVPFNWISGNTQKANENIWYSVDLREVMKSGNDIKLHIENRENAKCKGVAQLIYECPNISAPSVQDFTLAALDEKTIKVQNSAFETVSDSIVYVNIQGSTGLRFWVEQLPAQPFDTIKAGDVTLKVLQWDTLYTQTEDTAWYIIPQSEIDRVRNLDEKVKPVAHLWNNGTAEATYKAEAAFDFPIVKTMMSKSKKLGAGKHYSDTIPSGTFDQLLKKDSVIVRVTRTKGSGEFQFRAELVKAFSGNTRADALPIRMNERYTQGANTEIWYKLNTKDLKKDSLYNKRLWISEKNAGAGDAEVTVSVYEGLLSNEDLLESYGIGDYRKRTLKKGQHKSHNFPAQAVYGIGDGEFYILVRTTDSLVFESKFNGVYAPQAVDPKQAEAKLLVPNVEYVVPGDNQEHWFMVCLPYMQNNYIYTDDAKLEYELNGQATIEGTFTFQDNMDCQMPVRKRTINKGGGHHKGNKPVRELIEKAIKKAGYTFDFSGTAPSFIDSLLHRYITKDSVTAYIRIKTDNDLKVNLHLEQTTADQCTNPMEFDWEHGNVNPAGANSWYRVQLDSLIIPDTCDLRLHVDNWSGVDNNVGADLYFDCNDPATVSKTYTLDADGHDTLDIDRDFLQTLGWADLIINYNSNQTSHIWAELIPDMPRDTIFDTIVAYVCYGGEFVDTIRNNQKTIDPVEKDTTWNDIVSFQDGVVMKDSLITFFLHPILEPELLTIDSMKKLNAAPLLVQGMQLYVKASNDSLDAYYKALGAAYDTIINIDTVYWAKPFYKENGDWDKRKENPLDLTSFYPKTQETDTLLLVIKGGCEVAIREKYVFPLEKYKYVNDKDTVCPSNMPVVNPDTIGWQVLVPDTLGRDRQIDTIITYYARIKPMLYTESELVAKPVVANKADIDTTYTLSSLKQQFEDDATELTMKVTDAKWQVNNGTDWQDLPYTVSDIATLVTMRYIIETECGVKDTSENINFVLTPTCENDTVRMTTPVHGCSTYHWAKNNQDYTATNKYYYDATDEPVGISCHKVYELNLIIDQPGDGEEYVTICDTELPYMWKGEARATAGDHTFDTLTVAGCDSTITLHLFVKQSTTGDEYITICDKELPYNWKGIDRPSAGTYTFDTLNVANCDSLITLHLTVLNSTTGDEYATICSSELPYSWKGIDRPSAGTYTFDTLNVANCDSTITLHLTVNQAYTMPKDSVTSCNKYEWRGVTYTETGIYYDSLTTKAGCDSVYVLDLTIKGPSYIDSLDIKAYYGYRIVMINRNQINKLDGWSLDSLDVEHPEYVTWHEIDLSGNDTVVGDGYYYNLENGEPLPTGYQYYAVIDVPASASAECGVQGKTKTITVGATAAAPALVPSLAKPGETIQVINLDPEVETTIRLFTAEGLLQKTYRSYGQESFSIKAAGDMGFYLVELSADNMKSTLRYIVK